MATQVKDEHGNAGGKDGQPVGQGVFHVNEREGRVNAHGEELSGSEILNRVGLTSEKYELFTVEHGRTGAEIKPTQIVPVKSGDHFRATLRGTDYSFPKGGRNS